MTHWTAVCAAGDGTGNLLGGGRTTNRIVAKAPSAHDAIAAVKSWRQMAKRRSANAIQASVMVPECATLYHRVSERSRWRQLTQTFV